MANSGDGVATNASPPPENPNPAEKSENSAADSAPIDENPPSKRKLDEIEPIGDEEAPLKKQEVLKTEDDGVDESKRVDEDGIGNCEDKEEVKDGDGRSLEVKENDAAETEIEKGDVEHQGDGGVMESGKDVDEDLSAENGQASTVQDGHNVSAPQNESSHKIEIPNSKVGVLIGKAGDTIKFLQISSGAKIQITRDADADTQSSTRPVELLGTPEQINKAEKLIKDVIAEADAGGSPALVARGIGNQSGGDQVEIKVPNDKVGLVIGKGGETIRNLQTRSGARIQLIPHLPEGDAPKERIVRITGSKKHIEVAKEMIKEAMSQTRGRSLSHTGGYNQHGFRPHGPSPMSQWGARPTGPAMGYNYQQRGSYPPPQSAQYHQSYGGYSQPPPPRGGFGGGWDQRSGVPVQGAPPSGGYDYYGHGGHGNQNQPIPNTTHGSTPAPANYNYGQSQPPNYGHPAPYNQTTHSYGPGYNENQTAGAHYYGQQQPTGTQPGPYGQQAGAPQPGYGQPQPYNKAGYGMPQDIPSAYGPPRASHPTDPMYQGSAPSSYPNQQSYPYGSTAPSQPVPAYNQTYPASGAVDGFTQPPATYPQHGGQATPGYVQGQPAPAYTQPASQPGAYGQYPSTQQGYADPATANANYPYHGATADTGYASAAPTAGYGTAPQAASQPGYAQATANPTGYYDQSVPPQAGFAAQQQPAAPAS